MVKVFSCYNEDRVEIHLISVKVLQSQCTKHKNLLILQSVKFTGWTDWVIIIITAALMCKYHLNVGDWADLFIYLLKCRAETWGQLITQPSELHRLNSTWIISLHFLPVTILDFPAPSFCRRSVLNHLFHHVYTNLLIQKEQLLTLPPARTLVPVRLYFQL